ncbi:hypothetical protein ACFYTQ_17255 [Nocardia sp. NPDC004068]|uniref:hypothetical protein n=1 Tax=Nocardia sp. NPDC004068 TaxID=3364303 RepID=UPI0036AC4712
MKFEIKHLRDDDDSPLVVTGTEIDKYEPCVRYDTRAEAEVNAVTVYSVDLGLPWWLEPQVRACKAKHAELVIFPAPALLTLTGPPRESDAGSEQDILITGPEGTSRVRCVMTDGGYDCGTCLRSRSVTYYQLADGPTPPTPPWLADLELTMCVCGAGAIMPDWTPRPARPLTKSDGTDCGATASK